MDTMSFYVEKDTDQMRSTLKAIGLARLIQACAATGSGAETTIEDRGSLYLITTTQRRDDMRGSVAANGLPPLLPAIRKALSAKERKELEAGGDERAIRRRYEPEGFPRDHVVDYEREKQKAIDARSQEKRRTREEGDASQRHPHYPLWAHLCSYFGKGSAMRVGYPLLIHAWHAHQRQDAPAFFDLILDCYGEFPNPVDEARIRWLKHIKPVLNYSDFEMFGWKASQADISALSIISPTTAQGAFTDNGARTINSDTPEVFWLEMYLAFAGFMLVGMPYNADGDVLLYYPLPRKISVDQLEKLMEEYRNSHEVNLLYDYSNLFPRAKTDVISVLNFYSEMVRHVRANLSTGRFATVNAISAIVGYYYKDISTQIPFDETTFALPPWLPLEADKEALDEAEALITAHLGPIRALRGDNADELAILNHYRRFAALGDPDDYIRFAASYSQHRFRKLVDNPKFASIKLEDFETTMNATSSRSHKDYSPILANGGFQRIAAAIRACTVWLRYQKDVKNSNSAFKVRHGLGDDLRRRAHNADQFITDLSAFVHDYMRESASVQASTRETRPFITLEDVADVVDLISIYGSEVVANLLVAAGYTSRRAEDKGIGEPEPNGDPLQAES